MPGPSLAPFFIPFITGLSTALALGAMFRIFYGMRLNLFLVNDDSTVADQSLIPITTEGKKRSLINTISNGNWREDVDLTLTDYEGHSYAYRVGYHLWNRFYVMFRGTNPNTQTKIDGRLVKPARRYRLRTGQRLQVGDRVFTVLVTTTQMKPEMHHELLGD